MGKKPTRKAILLVLLTCILSMVPSQAFASETTQDNVALALSTDKANYSEGDKITGKATVKNNNATAINAVSLSVELPQSLGFKTTANLITQATLNAGESITVDFEADIPASNTANDTQKKDSKNLASTNDATSGIIIALIVVFCIAGGAIIAARKRNAKGSAVLMVLLAAVVAMPLMASTVPLIANADPSHLTTSETIKVKGQDYELKALATYELTQPSAPQSFTFTKTDEINTGLAGAEFTLTSSDNTFSKTSTSDATGAVSFADIPQGTYNLTETQSPLGYQDNPIIYPVVVSEGSVVINGTAAADFTVVNTPITQSFTFSKVDRSNNPLANAVFTLSNTSGFSTTSTSNSEGDVTFSDIRIGTYTLIESQSPPGYKPNATTYNVVVTANAVTIDSLPAFTFIVANEPQARSAQPTSIDRIAPYAPSITGLGVDGSTITVYCPNGAILTTQVVGLSWVLKLNGQYIPQSGDVVEATQTEQNKSESTRLPKEVAPF